MYSPVTLFHANHHSSTSVRLLANYHLLLERERFTVHSRCEQKHHTCHVLPAFASPESSASATVGGQKKKANHHPPKHRPGEVDIAAVQGSSIFSVVLR